MSSYCNGFQESISPSSKVSTSRQKGVDLVKKLSFYYRCNGQFFVQIEMHANCKKMNSKNFRETDRK